jgi:hypothetical protein
MVNRSLLEDALDVYWVAANPEDAPALADKHEHAIELGERAMFERFGRPGVESLDETEREKLKQLSKDYEGFRRSWTLTSDTRRLELVLQRWTNPENNRAIRQTYELIQRQNNTLLHSSPTALARATIPGRGHPNRVGPDTWWREALNHGALAYHLICVAVAAFFDLSDDALHATYLRAGSFTQQLSPEQLDGVSPSTACPCRSGLSFGDCHGS